MSNDHDAQEEEAGGLDGAALVATAWKAFQAARAGLKTPVPDWAELEEEYLLPFTQAVLTARDAITASESQPEGQVTFTGTARAALGAYLSAAGTPPADAPPDLPSLIAFEAVVRHVVNALAHNEEDHGDLSEHESAWSEWAAGQLDRRRESV